MREYRIGKQRTRHDQTRSVVIHVTVPKRIHDRIAQMQRALQQELGPDIHISIASVARRILYAHPALRQLCHRHYRQTETGDDVVM